MPDVLSRRILLPAALLALLVLAPLVLAPGASAKEKTCGEKVVDDWYGDGRVDGIFPTHCYLDAIRSLPVDVKAYSNAEEDIRRALAYAKQHKPDPGPTGGPAPTGTGSGPIAEPPTTTATSEEPGVTGGGTQTDASGPVSDTVAAPNGVDTSGPSSIPIPLLILGGLALLLLAAGAAGYLSRRAQARRDGGPPGPA